MVNNLVSITQYKGCHVTHFWYDISEKKKATFNDTECIYSVTLQWNNPSEWVIWPYFISYTHMELTFSKENKALKWWHQTASCNCSLTWNRAISNN